ncbi:MAG TPA: hypothetical protein VMW64_04380 [Dehalococcoidia bacterium]|nr:hypothetical protein [Dehalococcoidia bacterium]
MTTKCQIECATAGMLLAKDSEAFVRKTPVIFQENLAGLVRKENLKIQHSELAMHLKAGGKEVLAFFLGPNTAFAIYADEGDGCGYIYGADHEVLSPELVDKAREMWGPKPLVWEPTQPSLIKKG